MGSYIKYHRGACANKPVRHYVCACAATWPDSDLECHQCQKCKQTSLSSVYVCQINQILPLTPKKQSSLCVCNILRYPYYNMWQMSPFVTSCNYDNNDVKTARQKLHRNSGITMSRGVMCMLWATKRNNWLIKRLITKYDTLTLQ